MRRWAFLFLPFLFLPVACGGTAPGTGPVSPAPEMDAAEEALAREAFDLVNEVRVAQGLAPHEWHDAGAQAAFEHAQDMRVRGFFAHVNPDGAGPGERLAAQGLLGIAWAENLGRDAESARAMVDAWMASPAHREAILAPGFTSLGVGVSGTGRVAYWTQEFIRRVP